ncbi:MAG: helix-turn-helix transcriptional regulator [Gammaproteobacteria bacterium]|nr:helix-turn-helix transcriptional regulator [Gammaproteobacteria bacterium]
MAASIKSTNSYGQYCPLALAAELLCRRWTILIVSRLIDGCTTFSEIQEGVPRISPSLLSTRLAELEHAGIVRRTNLKGTGRHTYDVTQAGRDLEGIITDLAVWGQQWARDNELDDLDLGFLAWSMSLRINTELMPPGRTVIGFEFSGTPTDFRRFWLVNDAGKVDMCFKHPGYETDLLVRGDLRVFVETWRGFRDLRTEIESRRIRLTGAGTLRKAFPDWLMLSMFADIKRKAPGRERRLTARRERKAG